MGSKLQNYTITLLPLKKQLYGLSYAPAHHERIYYFLLVDSDKEHSFRDAFASKRPFHLQDYATVITLGDEEPPVEIKDELRLRYNAIL